MIGRLSHDLEQIALSRLFLPLRWLAGCFVPRPAQAEQLHAGAIEPLDRRMSGPCQLRIAALGQLDLLVEPALSEGVEPGRVAAREDEAVLAGTTPQRACLGDAVLHFFVEGSLADGESDG